MTQPALVQRNDQPIADKWIQRPTTIFLFCWTVLNLLQVAFTELTSDEGYYWFYSRHLQWGYYDHPPMVALLIKWGSAILPGELGVRLLNVLLSTAGLWLFFTLLPEGYKQSRKTYLVLLSAPLLHYLTFLLFPDGPLLFFSLLFLVIYKRFLQQQNFRNAVLLGFSLAGMAYSKYHGALVLLFALAAYPGLLRSMFFYLALLVAALLFLPHVWWQYTQDFPTLKYHLSGRTGYWSFRHVGEYLSQQVLAIGPGLVFVTFAVRPKDRFERTLMYIIIGTFGFFLVSSFKTFVHFHWTSIAVYPLLYFAIGYYQQPGKEKLFRWLILPFVVLFFVARVLLMAPLIPDMHVGEDYYHGRKAWASELAALAGDRPVFMPNNLREASLYSYYSGKPGITLYNRPEKKSQYELWGCEDNLQGRDVLLVIKHPFEGSTERLTGMGQKIHYASIPSFRSYYTGVSIAADLQQVEKQDTLSFSLAIKNNQDKVLAFPAKNKGDSVRLVYMIEKNNRELGIGLLGPIPPSTTLAPLESFHMPVDVPVESLPAGDYIIYFGIRSGVLPDAWLSQGLPLSR